MTVSLTHADLKRMGRRLENGVAVPIDWVEHPPNAVCAIAGKHSPCKLGDDSPLRAKRAPPIGDEAGPRYKSKGEAMYGTRLAALQRAGEVREWRYEAITLRLGDRVRYTCDFYVRLRVPRIQLHEVKGPRAWEDARVKLQSAAAMYPEFDFYLVKVRRGAVVESITRIRALTEVDA